MKKFIYRLIFYIAMAYLSYAVIVSDMHWLEQTALVFLIATACFAVREMSAAPKIDPKIPFSREKERLDRELRQTTTQGRKSAYGLKNNIYLN